MTTLYFLEVFMNVLQNMTEQQLFTPFVKFLVKDQLTVHRLYSIARNIADKYRDGTSNSQRQIAQLIIVDKVIEDLKLYAEVEGAKMPIASFVTYWKATGKMGAQSKVGTYLTVEECPDGWELFDEDVPKHNLAR